MCNASLSIWIPGASKITFPSTACKKASLSVGKFLGTLMILGSVPGSMTITVLVIFTLLP